MKKVKGTVRSSYGFELGEKPKETGNISLGVNLQNAVHPPSVPTTLSFSRLLLEAGLMASAHAKAPGYSSIYDTVDLKIYR